MKRFLFIPSCALLALGLLSSCQKEEKSALELTQELTAELQKVTDFKTAEAAAPRVEVLQKRLQDASVRTVTLNSNALLRSDQEDKGSAFAEATVTLAREVGRIRASVPMLSYDGEVDREQLVMATAIADGMEPTTAAAALKTAGTEYMEHDRDKSHETPKPFEEYYGSSKLKEALAYVANAVEAPIMKFDSEEDVVAIPEPTAAADDTEEGAAEEPAGDAAPAPAATDDADDTPAPATDIDSDAGDDSSDSSDSDSGDSDDSGDLPDIDVSVDL